MKSLKFKDHLAKMVLAGEKDLTWRINDDKDLTVGDQVKLVNADTGEEFGQAELTEVWEKKMGEFGDKEFAGHEKFTSEEEMYATYREYYGDDVGPETLVKIARFKLI